MPEAIDILENRLMTDSPELLTKLLTDHTTQQNIFWATDSYAHLGEGYRSQDAITAEKITGEHGNIIRPRAVKAREEQQRRSREMAEVFTPSWLCNEMNNEADADWFGRANVFNTVDDHHHWQPVADKIVMPEGKTWQDYAQTTRLEITCGEAPFLVSRYDTVTGEVIPLERRIGLLDRKLRVVSENATDEEWPRWALIALGSVYAYEWQGDSLLLAREAVVETFAEYYEQRFGQPIDNQLLGEAAEIVSWNLWQMDGLKGVVPGSCREVRLFSPSLFGEPNEKVTSCTGCASGDITKHNGLYCQLRRWLPSDGPKPDHFEFSYLDILKQKYKTYHKTKWLMKFDYIIGNPPYQDETIGDNKGFAPPIYDKFMDGAYQISDKVELIHPARFLFNAGSTPKQWNEKMLNDTHLKVLHYEENASKLFPNTDIKGGVAITFHNNTENFGAIGVYTRYSELNSILKRIESHLQKGSLTSIMQNQTRFDLINMYKEYPSIKKVIGSQGKDKRFRNNIFDKVNLFTEAPTNQDDILVYGVINNKRTQRYFPLRFVDSIDTNLDKWKVLVVRVNGRGTLGEVLSEPIIAKPNEGYTQTFIGIGSFSSRLEAENALKYIESKFARTMLSVLKITQDNSIETWKYVPLQDFTSSSDIDWTKSVHEIDLQLYDKYGLTDDERNFIETHVKEME